MAKYYSSTFGKISGKHGNAVAVIRKDGSTYLRLHVPAGNPRTDKQQAHRSKFALTSKSLVPFNPIFKETIGITNGISTARSYAFKNAIVGEYPNLSMDYEKLMFSFGALGKLHDASHSINEGVMAISWSFRKMRNCHKSDSVSFIVFNKDAGQTIHKKDVATRSDREAMIDIDDSWANADLYLWAYVTKGDKISDSVFVKKKESDVYLDLDASKDDEQAYGRVIDSKLVEDEEDLSIQNIRSNHIGSSIQSLVSGVIVRIIMMIYNLLLLFNKIFSINSVESFVNSLIRKAYGVMRNIGDSQIARVSKLNLKYTRRRLFNVLHSKYHNLCSPTPISIMRC